MDGVTATVNYATEKAKVTFREDIAVADLIATVEATGYTAREPEPVRTEPEQGGARPALGAGLEVAAGQDERGHSGRSLEIDVA